MSAPGTTTGPAQDLAVASVDLARRFASGATMWCAAPEWPSHGRHVAVEFVHPVIMGKRALPAVHVEGPRLSDALRPLAAPGDILLVISSSSDTRAIDVLARAEAWGLTRLWLGAGPPGDAALAEHRCWFSDVEVAVAARSGRLMVLYHLLWELTHVVFEHPGLLHEEAACEDEVCITCSDEGRVAEVSEVRGAEVTATIAGRPATVDVTLLETVAPGDLILVHAGVALTRLGGSLSRPFQGSPR